MNDRIIIQGAFGISLVVHLLFAAATWRMPFLEVDLSQAQPSRQDDFEVEVFLMPDDPEEEAKAGDEADPDDPGSISALTPSLSITSIPDRMASETPPSNPDFLAMYHSIAADNILGGDGASPMAEEEAELTQVGIQQEEFSGSIGVEMVARPLDNPEVVQPSTPGKTGEDQAEEQTEARGESEGSLGEWVLPEESAAEEADKQGPEQEPEVQPELAEWWEEQAPSVFREGELGSTGDWGFDFSRSSKSLSGSGVAFDGIFSLNTVEWEYGPWMKRFENQLLRYWMSPYAYRLGIINGKTAIRLVVQKDGVPMSIEVVDSVGHESLHEASLAALNAFAPFAPLPPDFPEDVLVFGISLQYPALRR